MPSLNFNHLNQLKIAYRFVEWSIVCHPFKKDFQKHLIPIYEVQKKRSKSERKKECQPAFDNIKKLIIPPALHLLTAAGALFQF